MITAARSDISAFGGVFDARAIDVLSGRCAGAEGAGTEATVASCADFVVGTTGVVSTLLMPRESWIKRPMIATTGPMPIHTRFPVVDSVVHFALYHGCGVGMTSVGSMRPILVLTVGTSVGPATSPPSAATSSLPVW